jgi:hypothetical protein
MDLTMLQAFENEVRRHCPQMRVAFKDETPAMKVLAFFAMPFNPNFMTKFSTTIGDTIYFPSRAYYEGAPKASFTVLAHEFVHLMDALEHKEWFSLSYALPQILAPLTLLAYVMLTPRGWVPTAALAVGFVLACLAARKSVAFFFLVASIVCVASVGLSIFFTSWWAILFVVGLSLFSPLPSPWRTHWEVRGYSMNLAVLEWTYGPPPDLFKEMVARHIYGPDYYYMSWSKAAVDAALGEMLLKAKSGELQKDPAFRIVYDFLSRMRQLRGS